MESEKSIPNGSPRSEKSKIIRNREVDKAAKVLAEEHVLPESPGSKLSWDQMQEYLALLTPDMWNHLSVYVYRLRPKIRRQLRDPEAPNYIDCFGEPFDLDHFIGRHGGGKYMLQAVDTDKKSSKHEATQVFQCFCDIDEVKYPPVLEYAELELEARENKSYVTWLRNQGILDSKGNVVDRNSTPAAAANGTLSAKDILEILKYVNGMNLEQQNQLKSKLAPEGDTISKSVGDILLEKMKQDDPAKQVQMWSGLVAGLKDIIGTSKSDNGIAQVYDRLIAMQAKNQETVMTLIEKILAQRNEREQPRTALDDFDKVFSLLDKARQWGGAGSSRRTGWDIGYDIAKDIGLPAIQTFGGIITNIMALRRGGQLATPGAPAAPAAPLSFDPYRQPDVAAAYARSQTPPPAPAPPPPGGTQPPPAPAAGAAAPANAQAVEIFQQYGQLVLNAINNGTPGWQFADNVVGLLGTATHAMIANHGEDALVSTMLTIPEFQVFGEQRLRTFVYEFIHFEEFGDDGENAIDPDEIDVSKVEVYQPRERPQPARR